MTSASVAVPVSFERPRGKIGLRLYVGYRWCVGGWHHHREMSCGCWRYDGGFQFGPFEAFYRLEKIRTDCK